MRQSGEQKQDEEGWAEKRGHAPNNPNPPPMVSEISTNPRNFTTNRPRRAPARRALSRSHNACFNNAAIRSWYPRLNFSFVPSCRIAAYSPANDGLSFRMRSTFTIVDR